MHLSAANDDAPSGTLMSAKHVYDSLGSIQAISILKLNLCLPHLFSQRSLVTTCSNYCVQRPCSQRDMRTEDPVLAF